VNNVTENRKLCILAYHIICKWENQAKKAELMLRREQELDCMWVRHAMYSVCKKIDSQNIICIFFKRTVGISDVHLHKPGVTSHIQGKVI